jgi:general secretion pathway protein G
MAMNQKGMTLMEIMIVIAIVAGMMALIVPKISDNFTKARVKQSVIQLNTLKNALQSYLMDCGNFPSAQAGLEALVEDPGQAECKSWGPNSYVDKKILSDQFSHPFEYISDGNKVTITFLGKDGRAGGKKYDADVTEDVAN